MAENPSLWQGVGVGFSTFFNIDKSNLRKQAFMSPRSGQPARFGLRKQAFMSPRSGRQHKAWGASPRNRE